MTINFQIGDIVTLKSHPLLKSHTRIKELKLQVPPLMLVKEINVENSEKKKIYSEEVEGAKIFDSVKYCCVYFNANKSQFEEKTLFQSFLSSYTELKFYKFIEKDEKYEENINLIPEVSKYKNSFKYDFGKVVQLKTKKLEHRKSYEKNNESFKNSSFQTPDFILSGIKKESQEKLFYPNGELKKQSSGILYKVMWFNHYQQKFSEQYLPKEFFVEGLKI